MIRFTKTCYGVQFHPEMDHDVIAGYIEARREVLLAEGFDVAGLLSALSAGQLGSRTLLNFVVHIVPRPA